MMLASGVAILVPAVGVYVLSARDYVVWALLSTLASVFISVDFGMGQFVVRLTTTSSLAARTFLSAAIVSAGVAAVFGAIIILAWPSYSEIAGIQADSQSVQAAIALVTIGSILRSVGQLFAAVALGRGLFVRRGSMLIAGALSYTAATLVCLYFDMGIFALGAGLAFGGLVQIVIGLIGERFRDSNLGPSVYREMREFVVSKGIGSLLAIAVTQGDRWVLAILAPPGFVVVYDIAARFAGAIRAAVSSFTHGLSAESAAIAGSAREGRSALFVKSMTVVSLTVVAGSVVAFLLTAVSLHRGDVDWVLVSLGLIAATSAACLTIVPTVLMAGAGRPWYELAYMAPLGLACGVIYAVALLQSSYWVFFVGWVSANILVALVYLIFGSRAYCNRGGAVLEQDSEHGTFVRR